MIYTMLQPEAPRAAPLPPRFRAMALCRAGAGALEASELEQRALSPTELRLRVHTCGVCRTDLHLVDGELPGTTLPRVPGHEIVGTVVELGAACHRFALGQRVGVPWLHGTCGHCRFCTSSRENLCEAARFTGWTVDGGYAEYAVADESFAFALPEAFDDERAAPLLCAGLIGWRALNLAGGAEALGIYGFGAAGHLIAQVALAQGRTVYAFTRRGDQPAQQLALRLGAHWAGDSASAPPRPLQAALIFAPAGELLTTALEHSEAGATIVCAGIHMSDIPSFPYRILWRERCVRSVANLTRRDGETFFAWAAKHPLQLETTLYPLRDANRALADLRSGRITGAAVLDCRSAPA
jgi:propanol-preferring alcohol dehydrogenase